MIEQVLPAGCAAVEAFGDPPAVALHPQERAALVRAVPKRRREYATGRHCARLALARLGVPAVAIPSGVRGAPQWPDGVVGSITHCDGYRAAAVARTEAVASVGIDAEPARPLPEGVLGLVASPAEQGRLRTLATEHPGVAWERVLFSAKEAVYKAWFPLTGRFLEFGEAEVTIDVPSGTFSATLRVPGPVVDGQEWGTFAGRFVMQKGLVVTAVARPRAALDLC